MGNETKKIDEKLKRELFLTLPKDKKIKNLTTSTKLVLAQLINLQQTQYFEENECVFASHEFLANELLINKKTAQRAIATLLSLGLIVKCESSKGKAQSYKVVCTTVDKTENDHQNVCGQTVNKKDEQELRIKQLENDILELKAVIAEILKNKLSTDKTVDKTENVHSQTIDKTVDISNRVSNGYVPKTHITNFIPISYNEMLGIITTTHTCQGVDGLDDASKFVCVKIDENGRQILD